MSLTIQSGSYNIYLSNVISFLPYKMLSFNNCLHCLFNSINPNLSNSTIYIKPLLKYTFFFNTFFHILFEHIPGENVEYKEVDYAKANTKSIDNNQKTLSQPNWF